MSQHDDGCRCANCSLARAEAARADHPPSCGCDLCVLTTAAKAVLRMSADLARRRPQARKQRGRRWTVSRDQMRLIHKLRADGYTQAKIMREVGVSRALVRRVLDIDPEQIPDTAFEQG